MAISCAHCGGRHDTPADVRRCWGGAAPDVPADRSPVDRSPDASPEPVAETRRVSSGRSAGSAGASPVAVAGPDALGRHAVVAPGQRAGAPWERAEVLRIDEAAWHDPGPAIARLREAAHRRQRLVIELAGDPDDEPFETTTDPPHVVGARWAFRREILHQLIRAGSVDLRRPERPRWSALDLAVAGGATAVGPQGGPGDIVTPDGTAVWIDAGPLRHCEPIDGIPVVPLVAVEHGTFARPGPNTCDADLAPDQLAAVTHPGGAARIIAPAGSGKTRVLTERARHLLQVWNVPSSAVTLVAFNKRAQEEMRARTADLPALQVRTLNSIALAVVNGTPPFHPQPRRWRTIDEPDVRRIIGDLVSFPRRRNSDPIAPWIDALGLVRLGLVDPDEVEARGDGDIDGFAAMWPAYRAALDRAGALDFDDQIHRALLVLLGDARARRAAQRACRVLLVDEFQDLAPAHLLLVRLLAAPDGAVFGVGDDDQTIYGYNGADPSQLIDFGDLFPGAGSHPLEVNYRCPAGVVEVADRLVRHNERRVPKTIRAASTESGGWSVDDRVDAVAATRDTVVAALAAGAGPGEVAVLTRVNALLAPVQAALVGAGVPIAGGVGLEFVGRTAVAAVLAWLRLAGAGGGGAGGFAPDDLREALRRPSRSLHPRIADWVTEQPSTAELVRLAGRLNNERDAERVTELAADIERLQRLVADGAPTSDVVLALVDDVGLAGSVRTLDATRRGMNRSAQGDDLTAVQHLAALHDDPLTFERWLRDGLAVGRSADGVLLATVHRVKGQEWPHVVVHHVDAEQYPHRLADDVEEERRLLHVALTRAGRHVTIVTGPRPSPFVAELTTEPGAGPTVDTHGPPPSPRPSRAARRSPAGDVSADLDEAAQRRFAALRELRNDLRDGKPAYVVFDNKTLVAIARDAPTTRVELGHIPGVGPTKLERYGDAVLELIRELAG